MTSRERRQKVDHLLDAALDLPVAERNAFLAEACAGDEALEASVHRLVARMESDTAAPIDGSPLAGPLGQSLLAKFDRAEEKMIGERIGPFRLRQELGRGGMAVVYAGERDDGTFEQQVAVKLIKRGTDTDEVLRRFEQERQILANLEHPAIARLIDGGMSADGRPYFAMERIHGTRVDRYCVENGLSVEKRLQLFLVICDAVSHAHAQLVVHRDIKPSNILVTDSKQIKLLDFGIAKLVDPSAWSGQALETRTALRPMTPEYASPEQVRGEVVTTATDLYQLGLLLYELLTDRRPFRSDGSKIEVENRILNERPTAPSTAVTAAETDLDAATRRLLRKRLQGDLDTIVLKALRKDPARRYRSVAVLREDLARFLAGRPISARPDTVAYQVQKFVGRHRMAVAAGLLVTLGVIALTIGYTLRLRQERDRVRQEAMKSEQMVGLLRGLFESASPEQAAGDALTVRELLDRGSERLATELPEAPETRASMLLMLGRTYQQLGFLEEAHGQFEEAVTLRKQVLGSQHPDVAEALVELAWATYRKGEVAGSQPLYEEALAIQERALTADDPALGTTLNRLGLVRSRLFDLEGARLLFDRALAIQERAHGPMHPEVGKVVNNIGSLLLRGGDFEGARQAMERTLEIHRSNVGADHLLVAITEGNLGQIVRQLGDLDRAKALHEHSLEVMLGAFGRDHTRTAFALISLGAVAEAEGDVERALELYQESTEAYENAVGPRHYSVANAVQAEGELLLKSGRLEPALTHLERAAAILEAALSENHPRVARPVFAQAETLWRLGRSPEAEQRYRRAIRIYTAHPEVDAWRHGAALAGLGHLLASGERHEEGVAMVREGLAILEGHARAEPEYIEQARSWLANLSG